MKLAHPGSRCNGSQLLPSSPRWPRALLLAAAPLAALLASDGCGGGGTGGGQGGSAGDRGEAGASAEGGSRSGGANGDGGNAGDAQTGGGGATAGTGGGSAGGAGGGSAGGAGTGGAGGGSAGGAGTGGAGGRGGTGTAGQGGAGGTVARACTGAAIQGAGGNPQVLRSDMSIRRLMVPPGTAIRLLRNPVGGALFLLTEDGAISRIDVTDTSATSTPVAGPGDLGLPQGAKTFGMAFGPDGKLFVVSHMPNSLPGWQQSSRATVWRGTPAGSAWTWTKLAETEPYGRSNTYFDHEWSGIVVSPDGRHVYVNCGSRTDHGEVQSAGGRYPGLRETALTARILRLPADASNLTLRDDESWLEQQGFVFARGLRNSFDPEFAPDGTLWAGDNGPDGDYREELNRIEQGKHYGFPWRLGNEDNQMRFPSYDPSRDRRLDPAFGATRNGLWHNDPAFPSPPMGVTFVEPVLNLGPDANQYRDPNDGGIKRGTMTAPVGTFSDHGSPLGLTFDDGRGALCGEFSGAAFILRFGKAAGDFEDGRDLLHVRLQPQGGALSARVTQIARNFRRPIDAVLVGERMYVLDRGENGGAGLYRVTLPR